MTPAPINTTEEYAELRRLVQHLERLTEYLRTPIFAHDIAAEATTPGYKFCRVELLGYKNTIAAFQRASPLLNASENRPPLIDGNRYSSVCLGRLLIGVIDINEVHQVVDLRKKQVDKFREAARQLETDDSKERFDATLERAEKHHM